MSALSPAARGVLQQLDRPGLHLVSHFTWQQLDALERRGLIRHDAGEVRLTEAGRSLMADDRPVLEVGGLSIPVGPGPVRCGIHGDPTGSGRCASCDEEADEEEPGPRCPACHDDGTVPDDLAPYGERTCPSCGGRSALL